MEVLLAIPFLAFVGERLSEYLLKPLTERLPWPEGWDDYAERLICAIPGFAMGILTQFDLFAAVDIAMPHPAGVIITAICIGGGANFLHDILGAIPDGATIDWALYQAAESLREADDQE